MNFKLLSYERMLSLYKTYYLTFNFQCIHCGMLMWEAKDHDCNPDKPENGPNGVRVKVFPEFKADIVLKDGKPLKVLLPDGSTFLLSAQADGSFQIDLPDVRPVANMYWPTVTVEAEAAPAVPMKPKTLEHMRLANQISVHHKPWVSDVSVWGHWREKTSLERNS